MPSARHSQAGKSLLQVPRAPQGVLRRGADRPRMTSRALARRFGWLVAAAGMLVLASCRHSTPLAPATPGPECGLSTTSLAFDTVLVGASAERSVTVTNTRDGTLAGEWNSP